MLNGKRGAAWFGLLHAILLTIFVANLVPKEIAQPQLNMSQIANNFAQWLHLPLFSPTSRNYVPKTLS